MADNGQKSATTGNKSEPVSETTLSGAFQALDGHLQRGDVNAARTALDAVRRVTASETDRAAIRDLINAARSTYAIEGHLQRGDVSAARVVLARQIGASS